MDDTWKERMKNYCRTVSHRNVLKTIAMGQVLSFLLCGTGVFSGMLQQWYKVAVPASQIFLNYVLLGLVYGVILACRPGEKSLFSVIKNRGWKYLIIAVADVEGNYLFVRAYDYTTITSIQLLDCFSIPTVLFLSYIILRVRYKLVHYIGVLICLLGLMGLVLTDTLITKNSVSDEAASNQLLGDILVIGGAFLYGVSNVAEEFAVRNFDMVEFLGMLGIIGSFINGIQLIILERQELANVDFTSAKIDLLILGFTACQFTFYSVMPVIIKATSAATVNLSILSADFYALIFGLFLFHYKFHALYFVSFAVVILGVVVYSSRPTPTANHEHSNTNNHNTDHNKTPYYQYRPVGTLEESTRNDSDTDQLSQLSNNSHDESSTLLTSPVK